MAEVLVSTMLLVLAISGILMSFLRCMELNEISRNSSSASKAALSRLETIRGTTYAQIKATYHNVAFDAAGLTGKGVSYVDDTDENLLVITVAITWKLKNGRTFGEDKNLNGAVNTGEDANGNGQLDAPGQLVTYYHQR